MEPATQQPQTTGITYCRRQPPTTAPYLTALNDGVFYPNKEVILFINLSFKGLFL